MTTSGITNINAKLIHQHPDNPRKDLGDLTELSESKRMPERDTRNASKS